MLKLVVRNVKVDNFVFISNLCIKRFKVFGYWVCNSHNSRFQVKGSVCLFSFKVNFIEQLVLIRLYLHNSDFKLFRRAQNSWFLKSLRFCDPSQIFLIINLVVFSYNLLEIKKGKVSFFLRSPNIGYQRWLLCVSVERFHSVVPVGNFGFQGSCH